MPYGWDVMNWQDLYQRKVVSIEMALEQVKSHQEIVCALCACEPVSLLENLHSIKDRVENVSVVGAMFLNRYPFYTSAEMKGHFLLNTWFHSAGTREVHDLETVSYLPTQHHHFGPRRMAYRKPDIFMGSVSPIDKHGYFSLSLSTVFERDMLESADLVILEVNPRLPRTFGDTQVHISEVDFLLESDREVPTLPPPPLNEKDYLIGAYVADLVEDGSTIQIGFGAIPGAVAHSLSHKKDLGIHSEMFTDAILNLYEAGAITNRKKSIFRGKFVSDVGLGTRRLYDFLDENMAVEFHSGRVVNNPAVIARNHRMVSINSAIELDLTGQCCAESIGAQMFSGTGGHKEFIAGALDSRGGKSILAFYATAQNNTRSRIVPFLEPGTAITTSRVDIDYVVTEYGVACLRGRNNRERVQELINIAHPDFRASLLQQARMNKIW